MGFSCPKGGGGGKGGGVPRQLFRGGTGHPHRVNSWTIGGFAQGIGALLKNPGLGFRVWGLWFSLYRVYGV